MLLTLLETGSLTVIYPFFSCEKRKHINKFFSLTTYLRLFFLSAINININR